MAEARPPGGETDAPAAALEAAAFETILAGREEEGLAQLEQAHEAYLAVNGVPGALHTATWLTILLMDRGDFARGGGWMAQLRRLADRYEGDCAELGYALLPVGLQQLGSGEPELAGQTFARVIECAERFGDVSLATLGRLGTGQALVRRGAVTEGVAAFDEAMVPVTLGTVRPLVAGIVYCAVIETCYLLFDLRRAQEWTNALSAWWEAHPEVSRFRGQCLVYRAQLMRFHGSWSAAMDEAERAQEALSEPPHPALGSTLYEQAELHRLRGEFRLAEDAYREASRWGRHPEPGLALLRLAQGRTAAAVASIRRSLEEASDPVTRSRLLPACVEVALVAGDIEVARTASEELREIAASRQSDLLSAQAIEAEGAVLLSAGDAAGALHPLRTAWRQWQQLEAPYEAARVRVLLARACDALGDGDTARLERDAAEWTFRELGATHDLADLRRWAAPSPAGLTSREVEVLELVAAGRSNREVALALVISERTVARHVSNILAKMDAPSRTAAAAYAREHGLI